MHWKLAASFTTCPAPTRTRRYARWSNNISLAEGSDSDLLLQLFLAREAMGSTAMGNGVAIPHPRHPVVLPVSKPLLSLCFLAEPIDFGAPNGEPVHTLFVLLSPTIQTHLQMLARVACLLRDERFRQVLCGANRPGRSSTKFAALRSFSNKTRKPRPRSKDFDAVATGRHGCADSRWLCGPGDQRIPATVDLSGRWAPWPAA